MLWMSIDPATKSGVAHWDGDNLLETMVVKPRGTKGLWYSGTIVCESRLGAWEAAYGDAKLVIIERGFGGMATAVRAQGMQIGWHQHACATNLLPEPIQVNVSEWRRVIKEDCDVSWPRDSKRCKALSIQLVKRLYGIDVSEDESDAVLLGRAALRMGLVTA